jgi:hypothetical protein
MPSGAQCWKAKGQLLGQRTRANNGESLWIVAVKLMGEMRERKREREEERKARAAGEREEGERKEGERKEMG